MAIKIPNKPLWRWSNAQGCQSPPAAEYKAIQPINIKQKDSKIISQSILKIFWENLITSIFISTNIKINYENLGFENGLSGINFVGSSIRVALIISLAIGPALDEPLPPCSTITDIAYLGDLIGA